ncbi:MAG: guanylate kinase [Firmicutes bacterium]|nr:guanylate kinase [Bacillota bacterium]
MIKKRVKGDLIVVSGPSGCGKDTICNEIFKIRKNIVKSISMTTRDMRDGEINNKDYYFVTKEEFEEKINDDELLEYAIVHEKDYYGTPKKKVLETLESGFDIVLIIDIQGALQIKEKYPEAVFIFIMPPSIKELKSRLINRKSETKESMLRRFKSMYKEVNEINKYNYVVVNDNLDDSVKTVDAIIESQKSRVDRIEELDINSIEEAIHEELVDL